MMGKGPIGKRVFLIFLLALCVLLCGGPSTDHALATEGGGGAYANGAEDFMSGALPPPGNYFINYLTYYTTSKFKGSNGNVPEGETFGQQENTDGSLTQPEEHFEVIADAVNNPQSAINLGERTINVWFTYPTPAGSIEIQVGILLR